MIAAHQEQQLSKQHLCALLSISQTRYANADNRLACGIVCCLSMSCINRGIGSTQGLCIHMLLSATKWYSCSLLIVCAVMLCAVFVMLRAMQLAWVVCRQSRCSLR
jgi:hypothetical protein